MKIDLEDFRRHYASLSDEALLDIDPNELTEAAHRCYEEEVTRRGLGAADDVLEQETGWDEEHYAEEYATSDLDSGEKPKWLDHADCVLSIEAHPGVHNTPELDEARLVLERARIPCYVSIAEDPERRKSVQAYQVMVPSAFYLEAVGLLDKEIFNPELEANWRTHLSTLSDQELRDIRPKTLVAGLLDRAERLTKAYNDEMSARKLRRDAAEDDGASGASR